MKRGSSRKLRIAAVAIALAAIASSAWAGIARESLSVFLPGVDRYGCLTDCGGQCATFCAVVNTCTGKFVGNARSCVDNKSCRAQCYRNCNFFKDSCISVACSVYTVLKNGKCCYVATGCLGQSRPE